MPHPSLGKFVALSSDVDSPGKSKWQISSTEPHRWYTRVAGGHRRDGAHWQLCFISYSNSGPVAGRTAGDIPLITYGGVIWATPTDFAASPDMRGDSTLYLQGHYHQNGNWHNSNHLQVKEEAYENGSNFTVIFDVDSYIIELSYLQLK